MPPDSLLMTLSPPVILRSHVSMPENETHRVKERDGRASHSNHSSIKMTNGQQRLTQELDVSSLIHNTVLSLIKVVVVHVVVLRVVLIAVLIVAILITIAVLLLVAVLIAFGTIVLVVPVAVVVIVIVLIVVSKLPLIILLILIHKVLIPVKIFLRFLQPVVLLVVIPLCAGPGQQHHHQRGGQDVLHAYPHRGLVGASQRASCRSAGSC
mmetsp:Transcript_33156/g.85995  ORF Transcript_33156/g.85995 Transcript_33156/m.85995 type:complete len:210 (-) Transcript_33156:107-736(-)